MSDELESTIGEQKENNWAFQEMEEDEFVEQLLEGQPFIPAYFQYDVELNRKGAPNLEESVAAVDRLDGMPSEDQDALYIDARDEELFKKGHIQGALNIQDGKKFETWLGTIVPPHHSWYLITEDEQMQERLIRRAAKIGYEAFLTGAFIYDDSMEGQQADSFSLKDFKAHPETFHIVDVRDHSEVAEEKIFDDAQHIPMDELMEGAAEVPTSKPIVVHCAGGYRSAIAYSILQKELGDQTKVFDLGEAVKEFSEEEVTA